MSSCNYHMLQDMYTDFDADLKEIASKIEAIKLTLDIESLDVDLDEITEQLIINNKLRLLELVGTDVMTEDEQLDAYRAIKSELFAPSASGGTMEEEEGEL